MNIDSSIYPSEYTLQRSNGDEIKFSRSIYGLLSADKLKIGEAFDGSNAYMGFDPRLKSVYPDVAKYMLVDYGTGDGFAKIGFTETRYERKINYRPVLLCFGQNNYTEPASAYMYRATNFIGTWFEDYTGSEQTVWTYNQFIQNGSNVTLPAPYGRSVLSAYPVTEIDLNQIVILPQFLFWDFDVTWDGDAITNVSFTSGDWRTYSEIKPADKTAAGSFFNQDMWDKGFVDTIVDGKIVHRRMCVECKASAVYGTASRVNLSAGLVSDFDGSETSVPSGVGRLNFAVLTEFYDEDSKSIIYRLPPGIEFGNYDIYAQGDSINVYASNFSNQSYTADYILNPNMSFYSNQAYRYSLINSESGQKMICPTNHIKNGLVDVSDYYSSGHHWVLDDEGAVYSWYRDPYSSNVYFSNNTPCFPLKDIVTEIASMGFFFAATSNEAYNGSLTQPSSSMYRGNFTEDGISDGTWSQGDDIDVPDLNNVDYTPDVPDKPEPEQGEESGDRLSPQIRYFKGASNFITQYAMTSTQVQTVGHLLWTSWVDALGDPTEMWQNFILAGQSYFNTGSFNMSEAINFIVSLKMFPFNIPTATIDSPTNSVLIGSGRFPLEVENIYKVSSSLIYKDFGHVYLEHRFSDYRDYVNMEIAIVLPYCGTAQLNPGDVINRSLHCIYAIDLQSGACTATVYSEDDEGILYSVCQMNGQIGCTIPLTATNTGQLASRIVQDVSNVAGQIHSGVVGKTSSGVEDLKTLLGLSEEDTEFSGQWGLGAFSPLQFAPQVSDVAGALARPAVSCPSISGGAGLAGFIQPETPYIQMRYGLYPEIANYRHSVGKPSAKSDTLSSYVGTGLNICHNVDVSSMSCHGDEKAAIKAALEAGVYL